MEREREREIEESEKDSIYLPTYQNLKVGFPVFYPHAKCTVEWIARYVLLVTEESLSEDTTVKSLVRSTTGLAMPVTHFQTYRIMHLPPLGVRSWLQFASSPQK